MARQRRTTTISKGTRALLLQGESEGADFKRTADGVSTDDLVAFANTESGGTILIGIDEQTGADGVQRGTVRGCDVSDAAILQILNKAVSCVPPIGVEVHVENLSARPILRVVVPPSESRPHCTPKGVYCRRDGSRNRPLHPTELLKIFLEAEARAFADRFESAADRITKDLGDLEHTLKRSIKSMGDQLGWAEYSLGNTESTLGTILSSVRTMNDPVTDTAARVRELFRQDSREDPVRAKVRKELLDEVVKQLSGDPSILERIRRGDSMSIETRGKTALELNKEDLQAVVTEAIAIATDKQPAKATKPEKES